MARVVIAGCGYVGAALARQLLAGGDEVWGLRRDPTGLPEGVHGLAADVTRPGTLAALPREVDFAVYCVGASAPDEGAYRRVYVDGLAHFLDALSRAAPPRRVFFTSSTSVYAQHCGEWVDESSPALAARYNGRILLEAERVLARSGLRGTVVRLGGIYGPGRTRLVARVAAGAARPSGGPYYTNRIHREDAAGALAHLMAREAEVRAADLYLGVDSNPAAEDEVHAFLAQELAKAGAPPLAAELPPVTRRAGSKRCRNDRLLSTGYAFRYPSYRSGYPEIVCEYVDSKR